MLVVPEQGSDDDKYEPEQVKLGVFVRKEEESTADEPH